MNATCPKTFPGFARVSRDKGWQSGRQHAPRPRAEEMFAGALQHHVEGRLEDAVAGYSRALLLRPDFADAHNNLGAALAAGGRFGEAAAHYVRALELHPDDANAHNNLGIALTALGRLTEAVAHHERAIELDPGKADAHYNLGIALTAQGRLDEADLRYRKTLRLRPDSAAAHNNLGNILAAQGKCAQAIEHYRLAIAIQPGHAEAHNNLGNVFRDLGQFGEALQHYGRAIAILPANAEAHFHRAEIKTFAPGDADLAAMETLANRGDLPAAKATYLHFAMGKALEDCGDHARSFEHLQRGNALKRSQIQYDEAEVAAYYRRIRRVFDRSLLESAEGKGDPSAVPVFVLGMPRSGSTLIEQILASHPQIHGAGELPALDMAVDAEVGRGFPERMTTLGAGAPGRIARNYLEMLPGVPAGKVRIVDKMPDNFLSVGMIRMILPNARIIHTMRNPVDTCVSCYSKLFSVGQNFSYDLAELGRYYRGYAETMAHWREVLPAGAMLDVAYEDVVDDLEGQAKRLIEYCGLPWDDSCMRFEKNTRPVKTASSVQVRRPLFRSSLQRWRKYEAWLGPLLDALGENGGEAGQAFAASGGR